jgi:hypothetical protein
MSVKLPLSFSLTGLKVEGCFVIGDGEICCGIPKGVEVA